MLALALVLKLVAFMLSLPKPLLVDPPFGTPAVKRGSNSSSLRSNDTGTAGRLEVVVVAVFSASSLVVVEKFEFRDMMISKK